MGRERKKKEDSIKPLVAELFVERSFSSSFQIIREPKVTDVRRKRIPLLWSTIRERERKKKPLFSASGGTPRGSRCKSGL